MRRPTISYYNLQQRKYVQYSFATYRELKKNVRKHLERSVLVDSGGFIQFGAHEISVSRCRRGEWGEWFETWKFEGNKPKIFKQGWM